MRIASQILPLVALGGALFSLLAPGQALADWDRDHYQNHYPKIFVKIAEDPSALATYCDDKYGSQVGVKAEYHKACLRGRDEAQRMAENWVRSIGKRQAYFFGYSAGVHRMAMAEQNNESEIERGQLAIGDFATKLEAINIKARNQGQQKGKEDGAKNSREAWEAAVESGKDPLRVNTPVEVPKFTVSDDPAVDAEIPLPNVDDTLSQEYAQQKVDTDFGRKEGEWVKHESFQTHMLGELWTGTSLKPYKKKSWVNPRSAWALRSSQAMSHIEMPGYNELKEVELPDGSNDDGSPRIRIANLQGRYIEGFKKNYKYFAARQYSEAYDQTLGAGVEAGESTGRQIGMRVAFKKGQRQGFSASVKKEAPANFTSAYSKNYQSYYDSTFNDYRDNPKVAVLIKAIIQGDPSDGILIEGEQVGVSFEAINYGGVLAQLTVSLDDIGKEDDQNRPNKITALETQSFIAESLTKQDLNTDLIASILADTGPNSPGDLKGIDFKLAVTVTGGAETQNLEAWTDGHRINDIVEVQSVNVSFDEINSGKLTYKVTVQNMSDLQTEQPVEVTIVVDGQVLKKKVSAGLISAHKTSSVSLTAENLDPLNYVGHFNYPEASEIPKASPVVTAQFRVNIGTKKMADWNQQISKVGAASYLAHYFDQVVNGCSAPPRGIEAVKEATIKYGKDEMADYKENGTGKIKFSDENALNTILGQLKHKAISYPQTPSAMDFYNEVAISLFHNADQNLERGNGKNYAKDIIEPLTESKKKRRSFWKKKVEKINERNCN